jgi:hypothetical protein
MYCHFVSNVCNKQNSILVNVMIKILLFPNVYYNKFNPLYFVVFFYVNINYIKLVSL